MKQIIVSSVVAATLMGMAGCSSAPEKTEQPAPPQAAVPQWGFMHLGRFSVAYHKLFGERPSDTLRRSR